MYEKTFNATTATVGDYHKIDTLSSAGNTVYRSRTGFLAAWSTGSSGSATLQLALVDTKDKTVIYRMEGTATVTALRTGLNGSSGGYVCDVAWDQSGNWSFDLGAYHDDEDRLEWRIGVSAFDTIEDVTVRVMVDELI